MSQVSRAACGPRGVGTAWCPGGYGTGVGTGWGIPGGYTGEYYPATCEPTRRTATAGSGPSHREGGTEAGWASPGYRVRRRGRLPDTHPLQPLRGFRGPLRWYLGPSRNAASGPIRRDSVIFLVKLVKTAECHQKKCEKASHSPYFQNGHQKSPLEILRFPFPSAFSRKELMGLF